VFRWAHYPQQAKKGMLNGRVAQGEASWGGSRLEVDKNVWVEKKFGIHSGGGCRKGWKVAMDRQVNGSMGISCRLNRKIHITGSLAEIATWKKEKK